MGIARRRVKVEEPLSRREFQRLVEKRTRYYFDMNVREFRDALHSGKLSDDLAATEIALLLGETPSQV